MKTPDRLWKFSICRAERDFSKSIFDTIKKCFETQIFFHSFKLFKLFKNTFSFASKILVRKKNHGEVASKVKEILICRAERHFSKSIFDTIKKCYQTQILFHSFKPFNVFQNTFTFGRKSWPETKSRWGWDARNRNLADFGHFSQIQ